MSYCCLTVFDVDISLGDSAPRFPQPLCARSKSLCLQIGEGIRKVLSESVRSKLNVFTSTLNRLCHKIDR